MTGGVGDKPQSLWVFPLDSLPKALLKMYPLLCRLIITWGGSVYIKRHQDSGPRGDALDPDLYPDCVSGDILVVVQCYGCVPCYHWGKRERQGTQDLSTYYFMGTTCKSTIISKSKV